MVDFTSDDARQWVKSLIKIIVLETGAGGWMHDSGEHLPFNAVMFDQSHPLEYHMRYIEDWAEAAQEALMEMGVSEFEQTLYFMRAGTVKSPQMAGLFTLGE